MSAAAERVQTWLWMLQRASAMVLGVAVLVHLASIIVAVRGGLTAAEIIARVGGSGAWAAFYGVFVVACAIHAPIGLRTVLDEMTPLPKLSVDALAALFGVAVLVMGMSAVLGFYGLEAP